MIGKSWNKPIFASDYLILLVWQNCWRIDLDKILTSDSIYIFLFMKFGRKVSYCEDVFFLLPFDEIENTKNEVE